MLAAQTVKFGQQGCRGHGLAINGYRVAAFKLDFNMLCCIWCIFGRDGARKDIFLRRQGRVFQHFPLSRDMQQIGIHTERGFTALVFGDRNLISLCIGDQLCSGGQIPFAPRGNNFDIRLQGIIAQLKAYLIIALASRAMRYRICAHFAGNFNLTFGDKRARNRCAQQIQPLI